jgi:hypothetical protein
LNTWKQTAEARPKDTAPVARSAGSLAMVAASPADILRPAASWPELILSHDQDGRPMLVAAHPLAPTPKTAVERPPVAEVVADAPTPPGAEKTPRKFVINPTYNPIDDAFVASRLYYNQAHGERTPAVAI